MKKEYNMPKATVIVLSCLDVISTSQEYLLSESGNGEWLYWGNIKNG